MVLDGRVRGRVLLLRPLLLLLVVQKAKRRAYSGWFVAGLTVYKCEARRSYPNGGLDSREKNGMTRAG